MSIKYFPASAWMWVLKGDASLACAQKGEAKLAYEQAGGNLVKQMIRTGG